MNNKRGISGVILTIIMIVLTLAAVAVIWGIINNILQTQKEQISLGLITVDLKIKSVKVESDGSVKVRVGRNIGEGEISGLKFIVSDGSNTETIDKENVDLDQLEEKTFTLTSGELGGVGFIKEISIAPVFKLESGKEKIGNVVDKEVLSNKQVIENLGGISWWKFDGDASDEIGGNHGTLEGDVSFVSGKFGKAGSFDGDGDFVRKDSVNLPIGNTIAVLAWIKPEGYTGGAYTGIVSYGSRTCVSSFLLSIQTNSRPSFANWCNDFVPGSGPTATLDSWNHIAAVLEGTSIILYMNGESMSGSISPPTITSQNLAIGCTDYPGRCFNGSIDEVMIFNKALTENQVKALYELDLS